MAEKVIIDIELKGLGDAKKGLDDLTKQQIAQRDEIKQTTAEIKEYEKELASLRKEQEAGGQLTDEQIAREQELTANIQTSKVELASQKDELSKVNTERRAAVKEVDQYNTALNAELGSNEQLKAQLAILTKEYNSLSAEERENTEAGQEMGKNIKDLTDKLKANESAVGDNRRNVGNYSESIRAAFGDTKIFGVSLNQLTDSYNKTKDVTSGLIKNLILTDSVTKSQKASTEGMTAAQRALNAATIAGKVAMNVFKLALIATGIGAFVVIIGSLVAYFTQTQKGAEAIRKVMAGLGATIDVLTDRLSGFGEGLTKIFSGDFSAGFASMRESFKGIGDEIQREVDLVIELEDALISLEKREIAVSVARSEINKKIKEQNRIAEDVTNSLETRIEAAEKVVELEKEQIEVENNLANERLKNILQLEGSQKQQQVQLTLIRNAFKQSQEDVDVFNEKLLAIGISATTVSDVKEVADAIIANNNAIAASEEVLTTAGNKLNTLIQQRSNEIKKAAEESEKANDEIIKEENERLAKLDELLRAEEEELKFKKDKLLEELQIEEDRTDLTAKEKAAQKSIIDQYNKDVEKLEADRIKKIADAKYKSIEDELKARQESLAIFELENEIALLEELEKFTGTQEEKQAIIDEYNKKAIQAQKDAIAAQMFEIDSQINQLFASAEGMNAADQILSKEQVAELKKRLLELEAAGLKLDAELKTIGVDPETGQPSLAKALNLSEEQTEQIKAGYAAATQGINDILNIAGQALELRTQERIKALDAQVQSGALSEEQAEKEKEKIRKQAFEKQKKLDIASATMSYLTGLVQTIAGNAKLGFPLAIIMSSIQSAILTAAYATNVAKIKKQKFQDGGLIQGESHAKGGVPFTVAGRGGFEAEGGEYIVKKSTVDSYGVDFMNALNNMKVPKMFAEGGYVAPTPTGTIGDQVSRGVSELVSVTENRQLQVINVEQDFTKLQTKVSNVEQARTY